MSDSGGRIRFGGSRTGHRGAERRASLSTLVFCGAIFYAPLAFGCTTPVTRFVLDGILLLGVLVFVVEQWRRGERVRLSPGLILLSAGILLVGCVSLVNDKYTFRTATDSLVENAGAIRWLPGTYDVRTSWVEIVHIFALLAALVALAVKGNQREQRWWLLGAIGIAGFVVAIIGIYQKVAGIESMLWTNKTYEDGMFFASFRYHGNAAAFLNLSWPACLAWVFRSIEFEGKGRLVLSFWLTCLFFTFGALVVNSSKFGHAIAIPALVLAIILFRKGMPRLEGRMRLNGIVFGLLAAGFLLVMSLFSGSLVAELWDDAMERGVTLQYRLRAYETGWRMWCDAPVWGYGAGLFGKVFPYFSTGYGRDLGGSWTFAHQDYLQILVEWGLVGGSLIFALWIWGFSGLIGQYRRSGGGSYSTAAALLALSIVGVHAMVDFPLHIGAMQLIAVIYLSFGWCKRRRSRRKFRHSGRRRRRRDGLPAHG